MLMLSGDMEDIYIYIYIHIFIYIYIYIYIFLKTHNELLEMKNKMCEMKYIENL